MQSPGCNLMFAACLLAACAGCSGSGAQGPEQVVLLVSGDTAGWIVPCGCTSNQSGGLLRRGSFVRRERQRAGAILVDVGGAAGGASAYDRAKFEAILQGELEMGMTAHNLGAGEARLGADYLREIGRRLKAPFVSCNLRDAEGRLVADALRIVNVGSRRIALVGAISESFAGSGIAIDPPREAVLRTIESSAGAYDSLVVLAYMAGDELHELARSLPEADIVVGGPTGQAIAPQRLGPTLVAAATNKGKFLARFAAPLRAAESRTAPLAWQGAIVEMNDDWSDDERQQRNLEEFYAVLAKRDFTAADTEFAATLASGLPAEFRIAGSESCRACHAGDCKLWRDSAHARAWQSLAAQGAHVDSYCQQCHTTGYGLPGGFESAATSAARTSVGCESCHGASQAHVDEPATHTAYFRRAASRCETCHDRDNSPQFDADSYWARIRHGEDPAAATRDARSDSTTEVAR